MKILYDNIIFYLQKYGGVSRYFSEIIKRISRFDSIDVHTLKNPVFYSRRALRFLEVFVSFELMRSRYDIYHPTYYSGSVKKRKNVKTIVTVYDMIHELFLAEENAYKNAIDIKKSSILNADHIICISENTKKTLQQIYDIKEETLSVVYLASGINKKVSEERPNEKADKPYLLYVGKRNSYKNFKVLLEAYKCLGLKDDFDLVCFGGSGFTKEERGHFKKMGLADSIRYLEGDDNSLKLHYRNAKVFIYPSLCEGFGIPLLEAMDNDCPVIASNAGSIPEVANDSALLFSPGDVNGLKEAIDKVLNNDDIRNEYIKRGRENVKRFSWDKTAGETLEVYKKVLNRQ